MQQCILELIKGDNEDHSAESDAAFVRALTLFHAEADEFYSEQELLFKLMNSPDVCTIRAKSFVEWTDHRGISLLRHAARNGYLRIAEFLLNRGADHILFKDIERDSPLSRSEASPFLSAMIHSHFKVTEMFLAYLKNRNKPISPAFAGVSLIIMATKYQDLKSDFHVSRIVDAIIERAGSSISKPFRLNSDGDFFCPLLSHTATMKNMGHLVLMLVQDCRISEENHRDALNIAAVCGNFDTVNLILSNSICLQQEDLSKVLITACTSNLEETIFTAERLIEFGASPNFSDEADVTAVSVAVSKSNFKLLELLLSNGGDPMKGFEYIQVADDSGCGYQCCKLLFQYLEGLHTTNSNWVNKKIKGKPLVSLLAMRCPGSFVQIAIEKGANLKLLDNIENRTPLDWACFMNNKSSAEALLRAKADINGWNGKDRWTCFHTAIEHGSIDLIQLLLSYHPDLNAQMRMDGFEGWMCLHLAVHRGVYDIIELILMQSAIDVNMQCEKGHTPLSIAVTNACVDRNPKGDGIVKMLLHHGADPNLADKTNSTCLIAAVESRHQGLIRMLLEKNADIDFANESGDSAISIAAENLDNAESVDIIKAMLHTKINAIKIRESAAFQRKLVKDLLSSGRETIIVALGLILLESTETRKIITDSPSLWKVAYRAPHSVLEYKWIDATSFIQSQPIFEKSKSKLSYLEEENLAPVSTIEFYGVDSVEECNVALPENMLTWAIAKKNLAVHILLEYENEEKILPYDWRSNLCINPTTVGTPLECAIDEKNSEAVASIMSVLESAWNFQFSKKSIQRNGIHPLDKLRYQDILYLLAVYPEIMLEFLKVANLIPAYSWVSGVNRANIGNDNSMWVCLTRDRSPNSLWKSIIETDKNLHQLSPPWKSNGSLFVPMAKTNHEMNGEENSGFSSRTFKQLKACIVRFVENIYWAYSGPLSIRRLTPANGGQHIFPSTFEFSSIERDVEASVIPLKQFGTYEMLYALVQASNNLGHSKLFESPVVTAVVQLHWNLYGFCVHLRNLRLYLGLIIAFQILAFFDDDFMNHGGAQKVFAIVLKCYVSAISLFFIVHEIFQVRHNRSLLKYVMDPWNFLDLPVFFLLFSGVTLQSMNPNSNTTRAINSVTALLLWCKVLYFMRCFSKFGSMILMIFQVMVDIRVFIIIFLTVMIGFGNAFFVIRGGRSEGENCDYPSAEIVEICKDIDGAGPFNTFHTALRSSFSYSLGNYDFDDLDDGLYPNLVVAIWCIFMILMNIILYNLLIAIISESYERLSANKIPAWHLEKARVIVDIYAGLSRKDRAHIKKLLLNYPWLQVLLPKKHASWLKREEEELKEILLKYPWLRYFNFKG